MRFAVVAAVVVHVVLIAWLTPHGDAPTPEAPVDVSIPADTIVQVALLDEPPVRTVATPAISRRRPSMIARHSLATDAPAPVASDAAPPPTLPPPTQDHVATKAPDLSVAQVVDHAPPRDGAPPPRTSELEPSGNGTYTTDLGGSDWRNRTATAHVARDGTVHFENAPDFDFHLLGLAGKFNPDDWIARKAGIDPFASAKRAYLDSTRDERARIAETNRADDLAHAQRAVQRNLEAVRAITDPVARKQALFELWDEVAETGDEALVRAGVAARAYLIGVIRSMGPGLTFTPAELAQLNAHRQSRAVFAPYD